MFYPQRNIRLKEFQRCADFYRTVTPEMAARSDGSLYAKDYRIRADENGFIASGHSSSTDRADIILLGDSVVENAFVQEELRIHRIVEAHLETLGYKARILNGGTSGASSLHTLQVILSKVIPLRPAMMIVMNGVMDTESAVEARSYWSYNKYIDPFSYHSEDPDDHDARHWRDMDYSDRLKILGTIGDISSRFGIPLAMATGHFRPYTSSDLFIEQYFTGQAYAEHCRRWAGANEATRQICRDNDIPLFDAEDDFRRQQGLLYDEVHMNEAGSRVIGQWLAEKIFECIRHRHTSRDATLLPQAD